MRGLNDHTLAGLAGIAKSRESKVLMSMLEAKYAEEVKVCVQERDEIRMRQSQGAAQAIREIINLLQNAEKIVLDRDKQPMPQIESYI